MTHHAEKILAIQGDTFVTWNQASTYNVYQIRGAEITPIDTFEYHPTHTTTQARTVAESYYSDAFGSE